MTEAQFQSVSNLFAKMRSNYAAGANMQAVITQMQQALGTMLAALSGSADTHTIYVAPACTVADLPAAPATGDEAIVTDSNTAAVNGALTGGGAVRKLVKWSGAAWQIQ